MSAADWPNEENEVVSTAERLEPLALLLIEDSPADSRLLQEHLREAIQRGEVMLQVVRRLSDAALALDRMKYSCVLVDLGLPDGQGVSSIEALRLVDRDDRAHRPRQRRHGAADHAARRAGLSGQGPL